MQSVKHILRMLRQEDGAAVDLDSQRQGKCVVLKTSTRQTIFLPVVGLVDAETLKPGDLVGVNKDSYLILDTLPAEYDSRVKAMEVDEKPTEDYSDVGGLDKQIQELVEAIVLPVTHKDKFKALGIKPPKVCLTTIVPPRPASTVDYADVAMFAAGCSSLRTTRHGEDAVGESLRSTDKCHVSEAGRSTACSDVHRRRGKARARCLCSGKGKSSGHHLHRCCPVLAETFANPAEATVPLRRRLWASARMVRGALQTRLMLSAQNASTQKPAATEKCSGPCSSC